MAVVSSKKEQLPSETNIMQLHLVPLLSSNQLAGQWELSGRAVVSKKIV